MPLFRCKTVMGNQERLEGQTGARSHLTKLWDRGGGDVCRGGDCQGGK